jgi:hypothetical protein
VGAAAEGQQVAREEAQVVMPHGWLNTPAGHAWLIRRTDVFGVASARYEKRKAKPPKKDSSNKDKP